MLAVTGSTGRLGGRIARLLSEAGIRQRLLVRDPRRAPRLDGATVASATYDDRTAVRDALAGCETVLMVSAAESATRPAEHRTFVDAAAEAGARHLVYVSFYGAAPDATFTLARDHFHTEEHVKASGMAWTFLRDNLYLDFLPMLADADGVIRGPAADGRVAAVAQDDIAEVASVVLRAPEPHAGKSYSLTGPDAMNLEEVSAAMSEVLGRRYSFHDQTVEEAYASREHYGAADWQVDAWVSTYTAIAAGELAAVTDDVARITGREPRTLADVLTAALPGTS